MTTTRDNLLASKDAALAAKNAFQSQYGNDLSDCAVGLGLNRSKDDWVVKVYARSPDVGTRLPHRFDRFEVDVEVTEGATAY